MVFIVGLLALASLLRCFGQPFEVLAAGIVRSKWPDACTDVDTEFNGVWMDRFDCPEAGGQTTAAICAFCEAGIQRR